MLRMKFFNYVGIFCMSLLFTACLPSLVRKDANPAVPASYNGSQDTTSTGKKGWGQFFTDPYLLALIDTALKNNQQLNIILQDIEIANYQIRARKGAYLPFVHLIGAGGVDKEGRYTRLGAVDAENQIIPGQANPAAIPDLLLDANVSWQVDIWKQLRNARKSAQFRFLSTTQGKNFMVTNLVTEIAYAYYELMALDNQLDILKANIVIQSNALNLVTLEKAAGQVTDLAVRRFQGEVRKNQSRQYFIQQRIIEAQNHINFLVGRYPQNLERNSKTFPQLKPDSIYTGVPSQLLSNRTDIKQAELDLTAAKLDVKVAKANFYPVLNITANLGYESFDAKYFITTPQSMLFNAAGGLVAPFINRNAIKAEYLSANARQIQAAYNYERTVLKAYTEAVNQLNNINNLSRSYYYKVQQVEALAKSIDVSINLFKSARADYVEVLLVQRDALEARMELIETKKQQMNATVKMYQVLGGGWYK